MEISSYHAVSPVMAKFEKNVKGKKNITERSKVSWVKSKTVYQTQQQNNEHQAANEIDHDRKARQQKYRFLPDPTYNMDYFQFNNLPPRHKITKIKVRNDFEIFFNFILSF